MNKPPVLLEIEVILESSRRRRERIEQRRRLLGAVIYRFLAVASVAAVFVGGVFSETAVDEVLADVLPAEHPYVKEVSPNNPNAAKGDRYGEIYLGRGGQYWHWQYELALNRINYLENRIEKLGGRIITVANTAQVTTRICNIVELGVWMQKLGYRVGEHPAFGGVNPVHVSGSYHYQGLAVDVNADHWPVGESAALDLLYDKLNSLSGIVELLWRTSGHYDHLHVAMRSVC